jgi:hypothetical protein
VGVDPNKSITRLWSIFLISRWPAEKHFSGDHAKQFTFGAERHHCIKLSTYLDNTINYSGYIDQLMAGVILCALINESYFCVWNEDFISNNECTWIPSIYWWPRLCYVKVTVIFIQKSGKNLCPLPSPVARARAFMPGSLFWFHTALCEFWRRLIILQFSFNFQSLIFEA